VININFFAEGDGYIGLLFRVKNKMTYYILTVGGEAKKGCVFKKVINGKYFVLGKDDMNGYTKNKWF
jgi:hypothetical protein